MPDIKNDSENVSRWFNRALDYEAKGELKKAELALNQAIKHEADEQKASE